MTMKSSKGNVDYGEIRALTIRQPFPELILRRRKPYEIRSWQSNDRGPLLIHSAARIKTDCAKESGLKPETLVTSAFVGVVVLSDVRPYTRADSKLLNQNRAIGGWSPGQFSWVLMINGPPRNTSLWAADPTICDLVDSETYKAT